MIEKINQLLESNDIMCRIGSEWYKLEEIGPVYEDNELEITMTDDDGVETGALLSDIEEFDTHDVVNPLILYHLHYLNNLIII